MNLSLFPARTMTVRIVSFFTGCIFLLAFNDLRQPATPKTFLPAGQPFIDTVPPICAVMPGVDVASLSPFKQPLTRVEAGIPMESSKQCYYEFYLPNDYSRIMISVNDLGSAAEARIMYNTYVDDFRNMWEREPERVGNLGDSAYFGANADPSLCDECTLMTLIGHYVTIVGLKGQAEELPAARKKDAAVNLAKLLLQRMPEMKKR